MSVHKERVWEIRKEEMREEERGTIWREGSKAGSASQRAERGGGLTEL